MDEEETLARIDEILALLYANPEHEKLRQLTTDIEELAERLRRKSENQRVNE